VGQFLSKKTLQEDIQTKIANTLNTNIVDKLEEASTQRAVWVRDVVKDIIQRVV